MRNCNKKIFENGQIVLTCSGYYTGHTDDKSKRTEDFVKEAISNVLPFKSKTDWHYVGGLAIVKTLDSDPNLIYDSLIQLLDKYKITKY